MAFDARTMKGYSIGVPGANGKSLREWRYATSDPASAVLTPGYFASFAGALNVGDTIHASVGLGTGDARALTLVITSTAALVLAETGLAGSPLRRLQTAFRAASGRVPVAMASPPTLSQTAPAASGVGTSIIAGVVEKRFAANAGLAFSVNDLAGWGVAFTTSGVPYYTPRASGTNGVNKVTLAFKFEGTVFELLDRAGSTWTIFVDGELVSANYILTSSTGYATVRLGVTFPSRVSGKKIVCYGSSFGFCGVAHEPTGSISPIDLSAEIRMAAITDSYGQGTAPFLTMGPFGDALMALFSKDSIPCLSISPGGGSGYITGGTGSVTFQAAGRLDVLRKTNSDLAILAGGINDATLGLQDAAAYCFSQIRTDLPAAVLANIGVWTPLTSYFGSGQAKQDMIYSALQGISGPWINLDLTRGTWNNSSGANGRFGPAPLCTGTGKVGSETGVGNSDFITREDGVHASSPYGNEYYASRVFDGLRASILAL